MEIHPRRFGEALSDLIAILGKVWRPLLMPALISSVGVAVASYFILSQTGALDFIDLSINQPDFIETMSEDELFNLLIDFMSGFIWVAMISAAIYGFLYLVAARAVAQEVSEPRGETSVTSAAVRLYLPWLVTISLIYVGVFLGLVLLIIPGIWLGVSLVMATQVIAVEEVGPVGAIKRSFELVRGNWWETLGFLLLVGLIGGTATQFIQLFALPLFLVGSPSVAFGITIALALAVQGLIMAGIAVAAAVWYLNLRARNDGPFVLQVR
jgi:hypothetical protein